MDSAPATPGCSPQHPVDAAPGPLDADPAPPQCSPSTPRMKPLHPTDAAPAFRVGAPPDQAGVAPYLLCPGLGAVGPSPARYYGTRDNKRRLQPCAGLGPAATATRLPCILGGCRRGAAPLRGQAAPRGTGMGGLRGQQEVTGSLVAMGSLWDCRSPTGGLRVSEAKGVSWGPWGWAVRCRAAQRLPVPSPSPSPPHPCPRPIPFHPISSGTRLRSGPLLGAGGCARVGRGRRGRHRGCWGHCGHRGCWGQCGRCVALGEGLADEGFSVAAGFCFPRGEIWKRKAP